MPNFFPQLTVLKIHSIDLLENLDKTFCTRIEELWVDTDDSDSDDPQLVHPRDITSILAKFENLKSLHLEPSSVKSDVSQLFSVCQKLIEIKRL